MKRPPKEALKELKARGHKIDEWIKRDNWFVGYSHRTGKLCTIGVVTGEAIVEILSPVETFRIEIKS